MGYGSYSASDWAKLKTSRNLQKNRTVGEVFKRTSCNPKFDPKFIGTRECFDSKEHPNTTPIVVGLDVTGSMGYLAVEIATGALNSLITKLYSTGAVEDPALMCAAYGDYHDNSPLQVTQFESDIRIAEQLLDIYFENGGNSEVVPTCLWEFLLEHTNIDAINKRHQKGFVFTIGDNAKIREKDVADTIKRVIGDNPGDLEYLCTRGAIYNEVLRNFEVCHITIGGTLINESFMCGHTIKIAKNDISVLPEIIISVIQLYRGVSKDKILEQWDDLNRPIINAAISQLTVANNNEDIIL